MKVILFGATGFIGGEVLKQLLSDPLIESVIVLSRRELPSPPSSSRLKVLIVKDFTSYPPDVLSECAGAETAIWSIGTTPTGSLEQAKKVDLDATLATAKVFAQSGKERGLKFRFLYLSGYLTEKNQDKSLWFIGGFRHMRGQVENELAALAKEKEDSLALTIARPAMVLPVGGGGIKGLIMGAFQRVNVDELAAVLIDIARNGNKETFVENTELAKRGKDLLASQ